MSTNYSPNETIKLVSKKDVIRRPKNPLKKPTRLKHKIKVLDNISQAEQINASKNKLTVYNNQKIAFTGKTGIYYILGHLSNEIGSLSITLQLEEPVNNRKHTRKLDLFEFEQVQSYCQDLYEKEGFNANLLEADLIQLSDLLSGHRDKQLEKSAAEHISNRVKHIITPKKEKQAVQFLSGKDLIKNIDKLIEQSGVIGEENNRKLLFIAASTFKTHPLHVLVQGSSGSGKSHLINTIKDCLPSEEVINLTRVTSKSVYHYKGNELVNKLIIIQDFDGLDQEAQLAFREAQSAKFLSSSTVYKDRFGNLQSIVRTVNAHFSSMATTTKAEVYFDNMSRSIIIGVDESEEQTRQIINHQNRKIAGLTNENTEHQAKELLQNCIRILKPYKVINKYADKIQLPVEAKMLRRLNEQFQLFVLQVTYFHQYQRKIDEQGRIITTKEDVKMAAEIFFDAIWLKVDELDSGTRQFFERLKNHVKNQSNREQFYQREIRQALNQSKSQCFRYFIELQRLEYIVITQGSANKGYQYRITEWQPMKELKDRIQKDLNEQIKSL